MGFSLAQLRAGLTSADALAELLEQLTAAGIDTTSWKAGSRQQDILQACIVSYVAGMNAAQSVANFSFNETSSGDELTALSDSFFDNQRDEAIATQGTMRLSLATGSTGTSIDYRTFQVSTSGQTFTNVTTGSLVSGVTQTLDLTFEADVAGSAGNVGTDGTVTQVGSTISGITVTNPAASGSSTWITRLGSDAEADTTLQLRNSTKWATLATVETPKLRLENKVLNAVPGITSVLVDDQNPRGAGTVDVYVAGDLNTAAAGDVTLAYAAITGSTFGDGAGLYQAFAAPEYPFPFTFTVGYTPQFSLASVTTAVESALDQFVRDTPVGGNDYSPLGTNLVLYSQVARYVEDLPQVQYFAFNTTPSNLTLGTTQKLSKPATGWTNVVTYSALTK